MFLPRFQIVNEAMAIYAQQMLSKLHFIFGSFVDWIYQGKPKSKFCQKKKKKYFCPRSDDIFISLILCFYLPGGKRIMMG